MYVRIFWVCAMKCMCAQTRPRFILSSERVFWGMEFEPMLTPREKSPLPENFSRGVSNPQHCGQWAQTLPTSYSGPTSTTNPLKIRRWFFGHLCKVTYCSRSAFLQHEHLLTRFHFCKVFITHLKWVWTLILRQKDVLPPINGVRSHR